VLLAALSTSHKLALGLIAGAFMVFALGSAMLIPRYRPDFPGERGLKGFLAVAAALFVATLLAVEFFAAEPKEATANEGATTAAQTTTTSTAPTSTAPTTTQSAAPSAADVAKGKGLYTSLGCIGCHSIDGAAGTGPTWKGLAGSQVALADGTTATADAAYLERSIADPDAEVVKGFQPGIMTAVIKKGSVSDPDIAALVAYIQSVK
jgi:cytochrome c2